MHLRGDPLTLFVDSDPEIIVALLFQPPNKVLIELSVFAFLSIYALLFVMVFAFTYAVGIEPGAGTDGEGLLRMNVLRGAQMLVISFVLSRFCVEERYRFLRVPIYVGRRRHTGRLHLHRSDLTTLSP